MSIINGIINAYLEYFTKCLTEINAKFYIRLYNDLLWGDKLFGYIRPFHPELKVKEYELYKSIYCGLCKCMGRRISCFSRLTLSYDIVFLVLLRAALNGDEISVSHGRCFVHPLKKRPYTEQNDSLIYCSNVSAILNYHKLRDDITDTRGIRRLGTRILLPAVKLMKNKADDLSELDAAVGDCLDELAACEAEKTASVDKPADIFGKLLAAVCEYGLDGYNKRIAHEIGIHVGRWIYIMDAADDYEDDKKSGSYNPLICINAQSDLEEKIKTSLIMELTQTEKALNLIEFNDPSIENIMKNIIYLGMINSTEKIFKERKL